MLQSQIRKVRIQLMLHLLCLQTHGRARSWDVMSIGTILCFIIVTILLHIAGMPLNFEMLVSQNIPDLLVI